ncbi:MAG: hypothetical protein FD167_5417, partial [bacterium]
MSSPLIKISDESWSLVCLCCNCAQEVRDLIKMTVGPAFVEYNHRFTCPHCQTYNQIMLTRDMFDNAQTMVFQAQPPALGGQNAPPFDPNEYSNTQPQEGQPGFSFDFNVEQASLTNSKEPPSDYRPGVPSFEAAASESKVFSSPPPVKFPSKTGKKGLDEEIEADGGLDELLGKNKSKNKGKAKTGKNIPDASVDTIEILGQKIPLNNQTKALAGLGGVVIIVAIYFFVFSGGTPAPTTVTPTPTPSASATPKGKTPSPTPIIPDLPKYQIIELKMVEIPTGEYKIGANDGEDREKPSHTVEIKAFLIDNREVTKEEYAKFVKEAKYKAPSSWVNGTYRGNGQEPVTDITWEEAQAYAKWAGKRLPTEEEWEVAASGKE